VLAAFRRYYSKGENLMLWNNLELPEQNIYFKDDDAVIYYADCKDILPLLPKVDLVLTDPPYEENNTELFYVYKNMLNDNGQILHFVQPTEIYDLPEKPKQILVWEEPISPKPIYKKYREFLDLIAWYAYGDYTFNKLMWNLMNSRFNDEIIRDERYHKWEKPETLIEKLLRIHTNEYSIILDPFLGSGTTAVAAKKLGRKCIGIEISEKYCQIAVERLRQSVMKMECV
jgi:hypothetical protein